MEATLGPNLVMHTSFFSPPVRMHGGLLCIALYMSVSVDFDFLKNIPKVRYKTELAYISPVLILLPVFCFNGAGHCVM